MGDDSNGTSNRTTKKVLPKLQQARVAEERVEGIQEVQSNQIHRKAQTKRCTKTLSVQVLCRKTQPYQMRKKLKVKYLYFDEDDRLVKFFEEPEKEHIKER